MNDIAHGNWIAVTMKNTFVKLEACICLCVMRDNNDFLVTNYMNCHSSIEQQGSRLKADYEVSWDNDGFFRNSRNQAQEKNNRVSAMAADHYRSEAPRRQVCNARHSPDNVRPRRFRVRFQYLKWLSYCL